MWLKREQRAMSDLATLLRGAYPRPIGGLAWPAGLRVLVLAPHPDDFDAIGVTMRFFQQAGHAIEVVVARTGGGVEDCYRAGLSLEDKRAIRDGEQRDSLRFFGLREDCLTILSLESDAEDQPVDTSANRAVLVPFVADGVPDIVLLPHGNDTNSGHRAMYSMLKQIAALSDRPLVALLNRDPKTIGMRTDLYMPFGWAEAEWKGKLLRFHDTQHQRNLNARGHGFDDRILDVNRAIARELSLDAEYAEAFEVAWLGVG